MNLDLQMQKYESRLLSDFALDSIQAKTLSSIIIEEVRGLDEDKKDEITNTSKIPFKDINDEIIAFQNWMDYAKNISNKPFVVRAQVIVQNYICFVYLKDSLFKILKELLPNPKIVGRLCDFLTNDPIYAFRNAFAHANWKYIDDFSGIEFWAREQNKKDSMKHWIVKSEDLGYWQALSRCVAYSTIIVVGENTKVIHN